MNWQQIDDHLENLSRQHTFQPETAPRQPANKRASRRWSIAGSRSARADTRPGRAQAGSVTPTPSAN
jgi:hypothetical protein